jgi:hypothetical protein
MPTLSEMSVFQLNKRLQTIDDQINKICPDLVAEQKLVKRMIEARKAGSQDTFAAVDGPTSAILACLDIYGDGKMTKKEIAKHILEGGYVHRKPRAAQGILNDTLNRMIGNKHLLLDDDLVSRPPKT